MAKRRAPRRKKTTKKSDPNDHLFDGLEDLYQETVKSVKEVRGEERRARRSIGTVLYRAVGWRDSPGVDYASSLALRLRYVALYLKSEGAWPPTLSEGRAPQIAMAMLIECGDGAPGWRSRAARTFRRLVKIAEDTGHLSDSASGKQGAQHSLVPDRDGPLYFRSWSNPSLWGDLRRDHARRCPASTSTKSSPLQRPHEDSARTTGPDVLSSSNERRLRGYRIGNGKYELNGEQYSIEGRYDAILVTIIDHGPLSLPDFEQLTPYGRKEVSGVLRRLRDRFDGAFAPFIRTPGARGRGGYSTSIVRHTPTT